MISDPDQATYHTSSDEIQDVSIGKKSHISAALWSSGMGCWEMNVSESILSFDHHISFFMGRPNQDSSLALSSFIGTYVHPEEQDKVQDAFLDVLKEDATEMLVEFRLRSEEEGYIWVLMRGDITRYSDIGDPERISGTMEDITLIREIRSTPMYLASTISANRREIWESFLILIKNKQLFVVPIFFCMIFGIYASVLLATGFLDELIESGKGVGLIELVLLYISYLFYYFLKAGIIHSGWSAMHAKKESLKETLIALRSHALSISIWTFIMMSFALVMVVASQYAEDIGLLICAIGGSLFFLFTYFVVTVIMCEKNNVLYAIIRSYEVFKRTRTIGVVGILYFAVLLIPGIVYLVFINSWKSGNIQVSLDPNAALAVSSASNLVSIVMLASVIVITCVIVIFIVSTYIMNQLYITLLYRDEKTIGRKKTNS